MLYKWLNTRWKEFNRCIKWINSNETSSIKIMSQVLQWCGWQRSDTAIQWRSQNEAEEAIALLETNLRRFLLVFYINFQLLENKRKEQSHSRLRQWLMPSLTGPSRPKFLAALLLQCNHFLSSMRISCKSFLNVRDVHAENHELTEHTKAK